ncbi:hypothetical protein [Roseibium polysiphoniae]|uniref:Secreted protein n=1 Tax=Roseibium polysiphoniae TaxID=2571221 RepID=A0ABR9C775_9HYPH|nr:hypothetical protein [Roseibium polysiphoniae]MBD8875453.1 hypothetical protein [Roseibium polysiphoniae]
MSKLLIAAALSLVLFPFAAKAQPVEVLFQGVINAKGKDCPRVTNINPIGQRSSGSAVVAAACSNGGRHVIEIKPDYSLKYISTCRTYEGLGGKSCF